MRIAVIDCETTGVEPWRHSLWEFGAVLVSPDDPSQDPEPILLRYRADVENASPDALRVNRYYERRPDAVPDARRHSDTHDLAAKLVGVRFASCNVSFDTAFVTKHLRLYGAVPMWHYSPIDIKSLCYGRRRSLLGASTSELLKAFGVDVEQCLAYFDLRRDGRHSAIADAYLAAALLYEAMGWGALYGSQCDARWGSYRCQRLFGHDDGEHGDRGTTWFTGRFSHGVLP